MKHYPDKVHLCECWARDGLQNQKKEIPTKEKLQMLELITQAGFPKVEATSFSHPKYVPQFKDAEQVLRQLQRVTNTVYKATCVNQRAMERAIKTKQDGYGPDQVSFVIAASESYNQINVNMSQVELFAQLDKMIELARMHNMDCLVSVSTAFGYSDPDDVSVQQIVELVEHFASQNVNTITVGDTTGMANPKSSYHMFQQLLQSFPTIQFVAHFHDTRGWGMANAVAALEAGVTHFDVSLGGIGGPPSSRNKSLGHTGNVCTEDFVLMLEDMGISTGINLDLLVEAGKRSEQLLGMQRSQTLRTFSS